MLAKIICVIYKNAKLASKSYTDLVLKFPILNSNRISFIGLAKDITLEDKNMKNSINEIPSSYREDIEKAVKILRNVGCKEIYLFGSLAEGNVREGSDIDLAIRGCPSGMFFHVLWQKQL